MKKAWTGWINKVVYGEAWTGWINKLVYGEDWTGWINNVVYGKAWTGWINKVVHEEAWTGWINKLYNVWCTILKSGGHRLFKIKHRLSLQRKSGASQLFVLNK